MRVASDFNLQPFNTLAIPSRAEYFLQVRSLEELNGALTWAGERGIPVHILGGGSNIILRGYIAGLTIQMHIMGREVINGTGNEEEGVRIRVGAGENWHDFVVWCLAKEYHGLENLALIPGTVGAAPVQNIGAYGVEIAQWVERVEGIELASGESFALSAEECRFSYRDSLFKMDIGKRRIITHVLFDLQRTYAPNLHYPALAMELKGKPETARNTFAAVCRIRTSKLPDPNLLPNCGSFFKNPIVTKAHFDDLCDEYPQMPSYGVSGQSEQSYRKLAAGWLIDQAGWRGQSRFGVSVHHAQALVLTNVNRCDAHAILALADAIRESVQRRFAVTLELEPQILGE